MSSDVEVENAPVIAAAFIILVVFVAAAIVILKYVVPLMDRVLELAGMPRGYVTVQVEGPVRLFTGLLAAVVVVAALAAAYSVVRRES